MTGICLLVISFILLQIRSQNKLLKQQKKIQEIELNYRKELLHAIIISQEQERNRIGIDLHDEVGTRLSSLRMIIENFAAGPNMPDPTPAFKLQCKGIIDKAIADVRDIAHNLSPFTTGAYGLIEAIEDLCDPIHQSEKIAISLQYPENDALHRLPDTLALALYRVIAELIHNTIKHARAGEITLTFEINDHLLLIRYADNGIGIKKDIGNKGMGMRNIASRLEMIQAAYTMDTAEGGRGFDMQIKLPLPSTG